MSEYLFCKNLDSPNKDVKRIVLNKNEKNEIDFDSIPSELRNLPCFNTLGFFKHTVNTPESSPYLEGQNDGLYVKNIIPHFPIKVVNLDRRPDRWEKIQQKLKNEGITHFERFSAVDGTKVQMNDNIKHLFRNNDFNFRQGFIGCALSHIKLWTDLVESKNDYYIIMEDDFEVAENFASKLNIALHNLTQTPFIDILFLGYSLWQGKPSRINEYPKIQSMIIKDYMGGFFGYIISKAAAWKYLQIIKAFGVQNGIDRFAQNHFDKLIVAYCNPHIIYTECAIPSNSVDSDIQRNYLPVGTIFDKKSSEYDTNESDITRVKLICNWTTPTELCKKWSKMSKNGKGRWNNIQITDTNNADYFVIINKPGSPEYYDPKKTILFQMEPWVKDESKKWGVKTWGKWAKPEYSNISKALTHKFHHNLGEWWINKTYTELQDFSPTKSKLLSIFASEKNFDEGHIKRLGFIDYFNSKKNHKLVQKNFINVINQGHFKKLELIENNIIDIELDIYGKGGVDKKGHQGNPEFKDTGLFDYKYTICVENNSEHNYFTEKINDAILSECLPFYWGCPNLEDYIDSNSFIRLDLDDFEKSYNTIIEAIDNNEWEKRIESIRKSKKKILNELQIFSCIEKAVKNN